MYKVTFKKGYDRFEFVFDDYDLATAFMHTAMQTTTDGISISIRMMKDGQKEGEEQ